MKEPPVAKVDDKILTVEMINEVLDPESKRIIEFDEKKDYVDRWVEMEILFWEAERRGLINDPFIEMEVSRLRKQLAVDQLLDLELEGKLKITNDEIKDYYNKNSKDYVYTEKHYKFEQMKTERNRSVRLNVENALKAGKTFTDVSREIKGVSYIGDLENSVFIKESVIPQEILKNLSGMDLDSWKRIVLSDGYSFIKLIDKKNIGDNIELDLVKSEIVFKILAEKRKEEYHKLINRLRDEADVQVNYSKIGFLGDEEIEDVSDTLNSQQN